MIVLHVSAKAPLNQSPRLVNRGTRLTAYPNSGHVEASDAQSLYSPHSLFFDNPDGYQPSIYLATSGSVDAVNLTGDFSFGASFYPLAVTAYYGIVLFDSSDGSGAQGLQVFFGATGQPSQNITARIDGIPLVSNLAITQNAWNVYRLWRENGVIHHALNGVTLSTTLNHSQAIIGQRVPILCGNASTSFSQLSGYLDELFLDNVDAAPARDNLTSSVAGGAIQETASNPLLGSGGYANGYGVIDGYVKERVGVSASGVSRRVTLHIQSSGKKVDEAWSNTSGYFIFNGLNMDLKYFVVCYDHTRNLRAETRDNLVPHVSPKP